MHWLLETMRDNPALPIFLTLAIGFWLGSLKIKGFSLGSVTAVLLVGVVVGQMDIPISGPVKQVFFLLFLFSIGYSVGPEFFRALRGDGVKQVGFGVAQCVACLICTWLVALLFGYNIGEAVGLCAGAQTMSAIIGVGTDTINTLGVSADTKQEWLEMIPVCYAVTYIYGTIGSAWLLGNVGPKLLGGLQKVKAATKELEEKMNKSAMDDDPALESAYRPVTYRAYRVESEYFDTPKTVAEIEAHLEEMGRRIFVERVRKDGKILSPTTESLTIGKGDEVVLSGRREFVIEDESWIGQEVSDGQLLTFPVERVQVMLTKKKIGRKITIDQLRHQKYFYGVMVEAISRGGVAIPVLTQTELYPGDLLTIVGLESEVTTAAPQMGYVDRPTVKTDMVFLGWGIVIGGIVGALTLHIGDVPISLSTSGGALIAGLVMGWMRSRRPNFGRIPQPVVWIFDNLGLNVFIAVVGITTGPTFISGLAQVGGMLFLAGVLATTAPLLIGIWMGAKLFKFHPAITLGCCAGARTTTAALGAVQDQLNSSIPAMGYTVTYAIGNTLLILWGVVIVLMMA
ncbi:MAG: aspartate-alanine antiporter [Bacteroidales bacterium]|nr:aspartate-alanine antiporter [Bacteroidales bacterium]